MNAKERQVYWWSRICLGLVWVYEGLVPKLIFVESLPEQLALVERSGLALHSPLATLRILGLAQLLLGLVILAGWRVREAALLATVWMLALIGLVGWNMPGMWVDPFGAFAKDLCLLACAFTIWRLHPCASAPRPLPKRQRDCLI